MTGRVENGCRKEDNYDELKANQCELSEYSFGFPVILVHYETPCDSIFWGTCILFYNLSKWGLHAYKGI